MRNRDRVGEIGKGKVVSLLCLRASNGSPSLQRFATFDLESKDLKCTKQQTQATSDSEGDKRSNSAHD